MADAKALLKETRVTFCVDTNILVEFTSLVDITWHDLAPEVEEVRVIVPTRVAEEMDEHKKNAGRLRRRGLEFAKIARAIEESEDGVIELRADGPRLTIEFGRLYRRDDLDTGTFDIDDPDNRIVAEVAKMIEVTPAIILLSDDSKPIRLAKSIRIPHIRPPMEWRRAEAPDERDAEIRELKAQIGAQPSMNVSVEIDGSAVDRISIDARPKTTHEACSRAFLSSVLEVDAEVPREQLVQTHGLHQSGPYDTALSRLTRTGLTEDELHQYTKDYARFQKNAGSVATNLHRAVTLIGSSLHIGLVAGNSGGRAAERVRVVASLSGDIRFMRVGVISRNLGERLKPPEPPEPYSLNFPGVRGFPAREPPPRTDIFHEQDQPVGREGSKMVSWRCEELRQGEMFTLPALVVAEHENAKGLLTVEMSSAFVAKSTVVRIPIAVTNGPEVADSDWFLRRLGHVPKRYRDTLRNRLRGLTEN